ncbi:iron reductase [Trametes maxima]|nr:iron reductase [Trametes maxima]
MSATSNSSTAAMMASMMSPGPANDRAIWLQRNKDYSQQIWWFIASFIVLVAVGQFSSWVASKVFSPCPVALSEKRDTEGSGASRQRRLSWGRLPLAIVNYFRVLAFRNTIDIGEKYSFTYAEVFITVGYIVALFTWEFINTTNLAGAPLDPLYWSGRAGALASSQFPLITALGTKNSLVSYITGISYDKLNFIHRMTARVVFILLWVHAGTKISLLPVANYQTIFIRVGLMAIIAYTILVIVAYRSIRARFYELFFFTHFAMVLCKSRIMLIGGYFHTKAVTPIVSYVWPSFLIWALDRLLRLFRIVYFNNYFGSCIRPLNGGDASVELLSPQFVRLRFPRPSQLKWTPGQAAFLVMPSVSTIPFEAHPFTIASVDSRYRIMGKPMERMDTTMTDEPMLAGHIPHWEELEFVINVREGFTKRLANAAEQGKKVKVFLDGPYGFSPNLRGDDTVVLVAGGSGISLALSMFLGLVSDVQKGKSRCRKVVFIWSIRDYKQLDWISRAMSEALEVAPEALDIRIRIFVTGHLREPDQAPLMNEDESSVLSGSETPTSTSMSRPLRTFTAVQITQGRPELGKLLKDEVATTIGGRMSVTVCGSQAITKSCRDALRIPFSSVLYGGPSVMLHVESFGYA